MQEVHVDVHDQSVSDAKLKSKKEKAKKANKLRKILKERLNIDCLRMLTQNDPEIGDEAPENAVRHEPPSSDWVMMREINECDDENHSQHIDNFSEIYSVRDLLGVGAFGVVLLVKNRQTDEKSALKIINKETLSVRALGILKNEAKIMKSLHHSSIVGFKRIYENERFMMIEMEYVKGGQLKRLYKQNYKLTDEHVALVMKSILEGVAYIHNLSIIHRDLKPENILMATSDVKCSDVKIVDFGLSAVFHLDRSKNDNLKAGTLAYMAPEQAIKQSYSKKVDLWACGIVMYQLLCNGNHPWYIKGQKNPEQTMKKLQAVERGEVVFEFPEKSFTPLAKDFFEKLCSYPSSIRYDADRALQHPWITRDTKQEIPMTVNQDLALFDKERKLHRIMRAAYFKSILANKKQDFEFQQYKQLLFQQSHASNDSTSDDSKRELEMALDTEPTVRAAPVEECPKTPQKEVQRQPSVLDLKKQAKSRSQIKKRVKATDESQSPLKISLKKQDITPAKQQEPLSAIKLRSHMFYVNSPLLGERRESLSSQKKSALKIQEPKTESSIKHRVKSNPRSSEKQQNFSNVVNKILSQIKPVFKQYQSQAKVSSQITFEPGQKSVLESSMTQSFERSMQDVQGINLRQYVAKDDDLRNMLSRQSSHQDHAPVTRISSRNLGSNDSPEKAYTQSLVQKFKSKDKCQKSFQPSQKESYMKQFLLENKQKKQLDDSLGITGVQFGRKIPVSQGLMPANQYYYMNYHQSKNS